MADEAKDPWYHRGLWSGLILLGAGALVTTVWSSLQATLKSVPPWVTVIAALVIVVVIAGLAVKRFRRWLFGLPTALWSIRPTTVRRYERAQQVYAAGYEYLNQKHERELSDLQADHDAELNRVTSDAQAHRERQVSASSEASRRHQEDLAREHDLTLTAVNAKTRVDQEVKRLAEVAEAEFERGREHGRRDVEFGPGWEQKSDQELDDMRKERRDREVKHREIQRVATTSETTAMVRSMGLHALGGPPPDPRWRLVPPRRGSGTFELRNLIPRSVAYEVRLECDEEEFLINDAGFWPDLHGERSGTFEGELTAWGRTHGATLWLYWKDEKESDRRRDLRVPSSDPPAHTRFDVSTGETPF